MGIPGLTRVPGGHGDRARWHSEIRPGAPRPKGARGYPLHPKERARGNPPPPTPSAAHTRSAATVSVAPLGGQAGHIPHRRAGEQFLAPSLQVTSVRELLFLRWLGAGSGVGLVFAQREAQWRRQVLPPAGTLEKCKAGVWSRMPEPVPWTGRATFFLAPQGHIRLLQALTNTCAHRAGNPHPVGGTA